MYDGWYIYEGRDDEIAEYYMDSFSDELLASLERDSGPFDDQYYDEMYADAESTYDEALAAFEEAQQAGDRADQMQMVVLIFAVGLALAAYGSIIAPEKTIRLVFAFGALAALITGLIAFFLIL